MLPWSEIIDPIAGQNGFAGVVSVDCGGEIEFVKAYGLAHRAQLDIKRDDGPVIWKASYRR